MQITDSPSPTGTLDAETIARYRRNDRTLGFERHYANLTDLIPCDECEIGIVQRLAVDYDPDCGVSWDAVEGCSVVCELVPSTLGGRPSQYASTTWRCPACTAAVGLVAA